MFKRKNKNQKEQGSGKRQVQRSGGASPAFSYYTSRTPDIPRDRTQNRLEKPVGTGEGGRSPRSVLAAMPFWLMIALVVVCGFKILWLSASPKVLIVGNTAVSAKYLQPTAVYAAAAQKLLASSIASHSKLTVNLDGTARDLEREFPELEHVSMSLPLISNRPLVYLQIAQPSLILQTARGNYALNSAGVVLARLHAVPVKVPIAVDQSSGAPRLGRQFLPSSTIDFVQQVYYQLTAAHLVVNTFVLPTESPYELDVRLEGRPYMIRYNLEADALTQSGASIAIIQQLGETTPSSYIDVRVPGRAYYK